MVTAWQKARPQLGPCTELWELTASTLRCQPRMMFKGGRPGAATSAAQASASLDLLGKLQLILDSNLIAAFLWNVLATVIGIPSTGLFCPSDTLQSVLNFCKAKSWVHIL